MEQPYVPFHVPDIGESEVRAVVETLRSGWLTTGPRVKEFEAAFAAAVGARHAVAVNSCTAGLHLALEAIGLGRGDEVLIPTMTFTATGEVVCYFGARPVLVDCEPDTLNLDCGALERACTPRVKAIIPVHFGGLPCDMDRIMAFARAHGLKVIEDAAHCFPSLYKGRAIGTIGDLTCFSFYATKTITTGEGGMITTENAAWADHIRMMSLHGISRDAWKRYAGDGSWYYEVLHAGFKYNLTDVAAALGLAQLKRADEMRTKREWVAQLYREGLADLEELELPASPPEMQHAWHLFVIRLQLPRLRIDRDEFIRRLKERQVGASVHFIPLHMHPFYRDDLGWRAEALPNASGAFGRIISLPIYSRMSPGDVTRVIEAVRSIVAQHRR